MPKFKLESVGEISLTLEYESDKSREAFFSSHLLKDAIVELITEADVSGWEKHEDELQPMAFYAALLHAVVDSCRVDLAFDADGLSDGDIIRKLLGY